MTKKKNKAAGMLLLVVTVFAVYKVFSGYVGDLDELWNYNMSRGIAMGFLPYRDYSMVQMPLFAFFNAAFLSVSKSLFAYRISCSIVFAVATYLMFCNVSKVTNEYYALPATLMSIVLMEIISYNTAFFLFALLSYMVLVSEESKKKDVLLGVLAALAALSRQTSGSLLLLMILVLLLSPVFGNKTLRERGVRTFRYLIGVAIPCTIFLVYLLATHSFFDFWDYCLFSLFAFGSNNSKFFAGAVPMIVIIVSGILCDIKLRKEDSNRILIHMLLSVPILFVSVPIVDRPHLVYGALWYILPITECVKKYFGKALKPRISVLLSAMLAVVILSLGAMNMPGCSFVSGRPELKWLPVSSDLVADYSIIADKNRAYEEEGYDVTTFSYLSVLISLFEGDYDPPYDMFLNGNFGLHDPMEYVEAACSDPDSLILMPDDYATEGWQNPEGVYEYITSHCEPVDSYGRFVWYRPVSE